MRPYVRSNAPSIAFVGTPNCGKTTLFNALTGLRQKVGNFPGVTVEKKAGRILGSESLLWALDLPGLYGLSSGTPEEEVSQDILSGGRRFGRRPEAVLVILDGSALERSLSLLASVASLGLPTAAALTMFDEIKARGGRLDCAALSRETGVPIAPVVGHRGVGVDDLNRLILDWKSWPVPAKPAADAAARFAWAERVLSACRFEGLQEDSLSRRIDRWALHPVLGPLIFLLVMAFFFQAIFSWARPAMEALSALVTGAGQALSGFLPEGWMRGLLIDGVVNGAGAVVAFLPQIMILFFLLLLLEDIGYLARGAFVMDRLMGWAGLQGRCFVTLISCYACAVPGILSARGIASPQDRLATIVAAPFITCSARLPVYTMLIAILVPDAPVLGPLRTQGLALLALYLLGGLSALFTAWLLRSSLLRGSLSPFCVELPPYRFPTWGSVASAMWVRAKLFLKNAGTVILGVSILLWALMYFPRPARELTRAQGVEQSWAGRLGKAMEPAFAPLGFDWRINVALLGSFAAREVLVSTLAQIYAVESEDHGPALLEVLRGGEEGRPLLPPAAALSLLVFFVYALQCVSTLVVMRQETGSWRWPAFAFVFSFVWAWGAAWAAYRLALFWGWS
ncbi:MAG TPA: ferrous iron transporter B [Elusimicrobia bacterium]|nr:ferrous iron transporter B [Elusimicrobiota bacterium]